jgi:hypothetical protein
MGLMDKVKQQAEQALAKAQQGVSQGQAKFDQVQAKRQADALLRNLGAAYYAKERSGGSQDAVDAAMKMLDEHVAAHGPIDTSAASATATQTGAATSSVPTSASAPMSAPATTPTTGASAVAGNFSIDDVS